MKTRKYVNFVTILVIFAVVSAFTGCGDGAEEYEEGGWSGPQDDGDGDGDGTVLRKWDRMFVGGSLGHSLGASVWGTFDYQTYRGIVDRIVTAIQQLIYNPNWFNDQLEYETFNEKFAVSFRNRETPAGDGGYWVEAIVIIIVESDHGNLDYQYYKVTDGTHLYLNHNHVDVLLAPFNGERMLISAINALYDGSPVSE